MNRVKHETQENNILQYQQLGFENTTLPPNIMRTINGPIKEKEKYRLQMNHEILKRMGGKDIVKAIKAIKWPGHVLRREPTSALKMVAEWNPG